MKFNIDAATRQVMVAVSPRRSIHSGFRVLKNTGGSYFLGCCGMAGFEGFNAIQSAGMYDTWQDKAEFMALLYRELYCQGTVVYALADNQLHNELHKDFLACGAQKVAEFPNMYHGPHMIHLFKLSIRNLAGRFCNKYGEMYATPEDRNEADIIPEQTVATPPSVEFYRTLRNHNGLPGYGAWNGVNIAAGTARLPIKPAA
jgi:hypothetical protein